MDYRMGHKVQACGRSRHPCVCVCACVCVCVCVCYSLLSCTSKDLTVEGVAVVTREGHCIGANRSPGLYFIPAIFDLLFIKC